MKNPTELKKLRKDWEESLTEMAIFKPYEDTILVVLYDETCETHKDNSYHIHRYFTIGENWQVSIDLQGKDKQDTWKHISKYINKELKNN